MACTPPRRHAIKTIEVTPRRTVVVPVIHGRVRCPFRPLGAQLTLADCAECPHGRRFVTDGHGRSWVHCTR